MADFATVCDLGPVGMVTLRGDLASPALAAVVADLTGASVPGPGTAHIDDLRGAAWMSPDELLLVLPHAEAAGAVARIGAALAGEHHLVADVSDARSVIAVNGPGAAEVLAKLSPVDLHPDAFPQAMFRRSRLGQVAAAFWREQDRFVVVCFRSVGDYALALLSQSAADGPVGVFIP
jgi:sarcosine oxidase, subunit gamma